MHNGPTTSTSAELDAAAICQRVGDLFRARDPEFLGGDQVQAAVDIGPLRLCVTLVDDGRVEVELASDSEIQISYFDPRAPGPVAKIAAEVSRQICVSQSSSAFAAVSAAKASRR